LRNFIKTMLLETVEYLLLINALCSKKLGRLNFSVRMLQVTTILKSAYVHF